jgi:hypothetical protein
MGGFVPVCAWPSNNTMPAAERRSERTTPLASRGRVSSQTLRPLAGVVLSSRCLHEAGLRIQI